MSVQDIETLAIQMSADIRQYQLSMGQVIASNRAVEQSVAKLSHDITGHMKSIEHEAEGLSEHLSHIGKEILGGLGIGIGIERAVEGIKELGLKSVEVIKEQMEEVVHLAHMSEQIDIPVNSLITLEHQARLAHVEMDAVTQTMVRIERSMVDAALGEEHAARGFKLLGLDAKELIKLPAEEWLNKVADAYQHTEDQAARNAAMMDIGGRSAAQMGRLFMEGSEGIEAARTATEAFGLQVSDETVHQMSALDKQFINTQQTYRGLVRELSGVVGDHLGNSLAGIQLFGMGVRATAHDIVDLTKAYRGLPTTFAGRYSTPNAKDDDLQGVERQSRALQLAQEQLHESAVKLAGKFRGDLPDGLLKPSKAAEIAEMALKGVSKVDLGMLNDVARKADADKFLETLKLEAETFKMTTKEAELYAMQVKHLITPDEVHQANVYTQQLKHLTEQKKVADRLEHEVEHYITKGEPAGLHMRRITEELDKQLKVGKITAQQYTDAIRELHKELSHLSSAVKQPENVMAFLLSPHGGDVDFKHLAKKADVAIPSQMGNPFVGMQPTHFRARRTKPSLEFMQGADKGSKVIQKGEGGWWESNILGEDKFIPKNPKAMNGMDKQQEFNALLKEQKELLAKIAVSSAKTADQKPSVVKMEPANLTTN